MIIVDNKEKFVVEIIGMGSEQDPHALRLETRRRNFIQNVVAPVGDIVAYKSTQTNEYSHVGIIVTINDDLSAAAREIRVLSKWGSMGEYLHPIHHVPDIYGTPAEFWTDRRNVA